MKDETKNPVMKDEIKMIDSGSYKSSLSHISLFIDEYKRELTYGFYTIGLAGFIRIGISLLNTCDFMPIKQCNVVSYVCLKKYLDIFLLF